MNLGNRGFRVIDGKNGPFVREYEVVYISPTGRSVHWKSLDGKSGLIKSGGGSYHYLPAPTIDEAVRNFQESEILGYGYDMFAGKSFRRDCSGVVDSILAAEKLRSSIIPG